MISYLIIIPIETNTYKTIRLPVVLYGCETWFLTIREEHGWGRGEMHIGYWWGSQKERDQ
jgi:hypothetical protein